MIDLSPKYFLMIEPDREGTPSEQPLNDELTERVQYLYSITKTNGMGYRGWHQTRCGQGSDNQDHFLPNGVITNSLCVYYVQHYRPHVPEGEIEKINRFYEEFKNLPSVIVEEEEEDE